MSYESQNPIKVFKKMNEGGCSETGSIVVDIYEKCFTTEEIEDFKAFYETTNKLNKPKQKSKDGHK